MKNTPILFQVIYLLGLVRKLVERTVTTSSLLLEVLLDVDLLVLFLWPFGLPELEEAKVEFAAFELRLVTLFELLLERPPAPAKGAVVFKTCGLAVLDGRTLFFLLLFCVRAAVADAGSGVAGDDDPFGIEFVLLFRLSVASPYTTSVVGGRDDFCELGLFDAFKFTRR